MTHSISHAVVMKHNIF